MSVSPTDEVPLTVVRPNPGPAESAGRSTGEYWIAMTPAPAGHPVTTKGATKANEHAQKGQATAESKRTEARERKAAKGAEKKEERAERVALKKARNEPTALLKGVKLSKDERKAVNDIEKKYEAQLKDLEKQEDAADKAGKPDESIGGKIDALRTQERTALRAA